MTPNILTKKDKPKMAHSGFLCVCIQRGRDTYYEQLVAGHSPRDNSLKYNQTDERILRIVRQSDDRDPLEYLRGLAHNYESY